MERTSAAVVLSSTLGGGRPLAGTAIQRGSADSCDKSFIHWRPYCWCTAGKQHESSGRKNSRVVLVDAALRRCNRKTVAIDLSRGRRTFQHGVEPLFR